MERRIQVTFVLALISASPVCEHLLELYSPHSEDVFVHQYRLIQDLEYLLNSKQGNTNGLISIDLFEKVLLDFSPQKQRFEISDLIGCAQSVASTGKDIDLSRLFDYRVGAESPFLQLLWQQGLKERELLLQLLQVRMFPIAYTLYQSN